jgi:5-methyltetrahydrofolate--homocysteine methyltransferase
MSEIGRRVPILVSVTVETTGTMLLGSEIGAALTALEPLGIDAIGLNCATGPAEMSEHLRHLSRNSSVMLTCMPNAGLPELTPDGARYPLTPEQLADAHETFVADYGLNLIGGCCGTTPEHLRQVVERLHDKGRVDRSPSAPAAVSSLYHSVPLRQDATFLTVGERTNAGARRRPRAGCLHRLRGT